MTVNFLDVLWITVCGILVFIMQAGFLCLEAGSTRSKNRTNVIIKNLTDLGLSVALFWAVGYGLMFGNSGWGLIGLDRFLPNLGENEDIWSGSFFLFQAMFCSTAVTILSGATAERLKFKGYLIIVTVVSGIVYPVFGHWVWQGIDRGLPSGWLAERGFVDFAGGTVVHGIGGWCSLAAVLILGPRLGRFSSKREFDGMASTDMPIAFLGVLLLWFGWFGFNGGSNLVFDADVSNIIANTLLASAAGVITPIVYCYASGRTVEIRPMMNGTLAALAAVTAGCHAYSSIDALVVGAVGCLLMMASGSLMEKWRIDDVVDAIPVHLVSGSWGVLATGLFGNPARLGTGLDRLSQIKVQIEGILACGLWAFCVSLGLLLILNRCNLLRVSPRQEYLGLNLSEHGAKLQTEDIFAVMRHHAKTGDLRRRVKSDPFTEVGQVGQWYNQVIVALERAIAANEAIIKTAVDGILTLSAIPTGALMIQSANPAVEKIFGYAPKTVTGQPLQMLLATEEAHTGQMVGLQTMDHQTMDHQTMDHQTMDQRLRELAEQSAEPMPLTGKHRSGYLFPLELTATVTQTHSERFYTVFVKDISARKRAEAALLDSRAQEQAKAVALEEALHQLRLTQAQLIQRERMAGQEQLVAGIAHEINNPNNFIHGNLNCAREYVSELLRVVELYQAQYGCLPKEVRSQLDDQLADIDLDYIAADFPKLIASMHKGTERIRFIVEQLRNFSRYDEADLKAVDVHESLESSILMLAHRLEATAHRPAITLNRCYGYLPPVECYASALNRAIFNIIVNAIEAFDRSALQPTLLQTPSSALAPLPPCITFTTQLANGRAHLSIANNGPHIPEAEQKRIFDPFFSTQPIGQGTGLGCTISYQIVVEQHGGQLICFSKPGEETRFNLEIPLTQAKKGKIPFSDAVLA